jgi:hypothetical protein
LFKATPHRPAVRREQTRSRLLPARAAFAGALRHPDRRGAADPSLTSLDTARLADQSAEDELVMVAVAHVAKVAPLPSAGLYGR